MKAQTQSTERPKKYSIENVENSKCTVLFFDNIEETKNEENNTIYNYDMYDMNLTYREGLEEKIEKNYEEWLEEAKKVAYNEAAKQVREKRNKLLEESDKEMCIDRLDLKLPKEITASNMLTGIKQFFECLFEITNGSMAKYRKDLRNITEQKGFPYDVKFPQKP